MNRVTQIVWDKEPRFFALAEAEELFPLWRSDLPMPEAALGALRGGVSERIALARGLSGHRGAAARSALGALIMDSEVAVRTEAGITLQETWGDDILYDPEWDEIGRAHV